MTGINKRELIDLIESLDFEWVSVTRELEKLDISHPGESGFIVEPTGKYDIIIHGYVTASKTSELPKP